MSIDDLTENLKTIRKTYKDDLKTLVFDDFYIKYFGKKGVFNDLLSNAKELSQDIKINALKDINTLKKIIQDEIDQHIKVADDYFKTDTTIDLTAPASPTLRGHYHPISVVTNQLVEFFHYYGFSVFDGPEIEDDYHNFEMLGVPKDHPARELQDTFYLMSPEVLLRTQTSSIEARELKKQKPPIRFVFPGKVFRNETASKTNGAIFEQFQGVCIDKNITLSNLKWIFTKSLKYVLGPDTVIRFRAKYYPEVEPGMSPDVMCKFCKGSGCEICKYRGWIEIAGGGMIHPNTLEMADIDPTIYSGFAFGWGLSRIAMQRFGIRDLRSLYNGSIIYE